MIIAIVFYLLGVLWMHEEMFDSGCSGNWFDWAKAAFWPAWLILFITGTSIVKIKNKIYAKV